MDGQKVSAEKWKLNKRTWTVELVNYGNCNESRTNGILEHRSQGREKRAGESEYILPKFSNLKTGGKRLKKTPDIQGSLKWYQVAQHTCNRRLRRGKEKGAEKNAGRNTSSNNGKTLTYKSRNPLNPTENKYQENTSIIYINKLLKIKAIEKSLESSQRKKHEWLIYHQTQNRS